MTYEHVESLCLCGFGWVNYNLFEKRDFYDFAEERARAGFPECNFNYLVDKYFCSGSYFLSIELYEHTTTTK